MIHQGLCVQYPQSHLRGVPVAERTKTGRGVMNTGGRMTPSAAQRSTERHLM